MSAHKAANDLVSPLDGTSAPIAQPRRNVVWSFWLQWTLITTLGWLIGILILGLEPIRIIVEVITYITIAGAFAGMFGAIVAASFGLMQGVVLKKYGFSAREWMIASCVGGTLGGLLSDVAFLAIYRLTYFPPFASFSPEFLGVLVMATAGTITGGMVGYWQGNLLQRRGFSRSYWVRSCAIGWAIGCLSSEFLGHFLLDAMMWPSAAIDIKGSNIVVGILAVICGLVGGALTGIPLVRMMRRLPTSNPTGTLRSL